MWLWEIAIWIWNNLYWLLPFGCVFFLISLTAPVTDRIRDMKRSIKYALEPDGFIVFVILTIIGIVLSGLLMALF